MVPQPDETSLPQPSSLSNGLEFELAIDEAKRTFSRARMFSAEASVNVLLISDVPEFNLILEDQLKSIHLHLFRVSYASKEQSWTAIEDSSVDWIVFQVDEVAGQIKPSDLEWLQQLQSKLTAASAIFVVPEHLIETWKNQLPRPGKINDASFCHQFLCYPALPDLDEFIQFLTERVDPERKLRQIREKWLDNINYRTTGVIIKTEPPIQERLINNSPLAQCTPQERAILELVGISMNNEEIAETLDTKVSCIDKYVEGLLVKFGKSDRTSLIQAYQMEISDKRYL